MIRVICAVALLMSGSAALAAPEQTDWGIRALGSEPSAPAPELADEPASNASNTTWTPISRGINMSTIRSIGTRWGRVTSTYRSPGHNRRVGGVANSYHLRNRAIDIARRAGVSHWQIAAAYRAAGYNLVESLDEGDHSHFAFGSGASAPRRKWVFAPAAKESAEVTNWRVVTAPGAYRR